jgi:DNA-binding NarL/FixJ family response regulator
MGEPTYPPKPDSYQLLRARYLPTDDANPPGPDHDPNRLTLRQIQVLAGICEGLSQEQVAVHLGIQRVTVEKHLGTAYRKLGVHTRYEAALLVRELRQTYSKPS